MVGVVGFAGWGTCGIEHKLVHLIQDIMFFPVFRDIKGIIQAVDSRSISQDGTGSFC